MRTVRVPLQERSYVIHIGRQLLPKLGRLCRDAALGQQCAIVTDTNVGPRYAAKAKSALEKAGVRTTTIVLPAGERHKSIKTVTECYRQLAAARFDRSAFIVALGGGVVGDLAGFVAATYLRGLPFVQVATTLLAQVDSSVGGKVGVNLAEGKNLVGAFYQPRLVLCDLDTLRTLPQRELRSGLAEVIKYGVIREAKLFGRLESDLPALLRREARVLEPVVARCCEIKAEVVGADERESGLRAILNFGHTVGHALEACTRYRRYLHGEAIAYGQAVAARLSTLRLGLPKEQAERIIALLDRAGLPTQIVLSPRQTLALEQAMKLDKKIVNGQVRFVLARDLGAVEWGCEVDQATLRTGLAEARPRAGRRRSLRA